MYVTGEFGFLPRSPSKVTCDRRFGRPGHMLISGACLANSAAACAAETSTSVQLDSNTLQRNSNRTAIEFQQLHQVCVIKLFCSGGFSWILVDFGGFRSPFAAKNAVSDDHRKPRSSAYWCGIDFQCCGIRRT